jgi:hypothetical protein
MPPSLILASSKENHRFVVIETRNTYVGSCMLSKPRRHYNEITLLCDGEAGQEFLTLKTEVHQKHLVDVTVKRARGCTRTFPDPEFLLTCTFHRCIFKIITHNMERRSCR